MRKYQNIICIIIIILVTTFGISKFIKISNQNLQYQKEEKDLQLQIDIQKEKQAKLKQENDSVNSKDNIEDIARKKMDMYKPNDVIYSEK